MPEPEISRRCSACGATVRQSALFCPQCGNSMANAATAGETLSLTDTIPLDAWPKLSEARKSEDPGTGKGAPRQNKNTGKSVAVQRKTRPLPAGAEQNAGRVDKLRKASIVVIDQAAYDPSLRFLLVAAVLFLLFLVLLMLSKVIG